jgi:hypothetical protein
MGEALLRPASLRTLDMIENDLRAALGLPTKKTEEELADGDPQ